jgi:hypothetical protein
MRIAPNAAADLLLVLIGEALELGHEWDGTSRLITRLCGHARWLATSTESAVGLKVPGAREARQRQSGWLHVT